MKGQEFVTPAFEQAVFAAIVEQAPVYVEALALQHAPRGHGIPVYAIGRAVRAAVASLQRQGKVRRVSGGSYLVTR